MLTFCILSIATSRAIEIGLADGSEPLSSWWYGYVCDSHQTAQQVVSNY